MNTGGARASKRVMPTSFTAFVLENPSATFEQFAWLCTRAMMPTILLRDSDLRIPTEADLVQAIGASGLVGEEERFAAKQAELAAAEAKTSEQWAAENAASFARRSKEHEESAVRSKAARERLQAMLMHTTMWSPPSPEHEGLKKFMVDQLTGEVGRTDPGPAPTPMSDDDFQADMLAYYRRAVEYGKQYLEQAQRNVAHRQAWFLALQQSVPRPG